MVSLFLRYGNGIEGRNEEGPDMGSIIYGNLEMLMKGWGWGKASLVGDAHGFRGLGATGPRLGSLEGQYCEVASSARI